MRVRVGGKVTEEFEVATGLKQGDALSPIRLNLALEHVIRKIITLDIGIRLNGQHRVIE